MHIQRIFRFCAPVLAASFLLGQPVLAQQIQSLPMAGDEPELIDQAPRSGNVSVALDLGQDNATQPRGTAPGVNVAGMSLPAPLLATGGARAAAARATLRSVPSAPATGPGPIERAVFAREPVRVHLQVGQERLITLPAEALLHVPADMDAVARLESIGGTIYATALVPFTPIRIIAELVDSGQQIPIDLVAQAASKVATDRAGELQVSVLEPATVPYPTAAVAAPEPPAADMVELTRHAARQLYAPRRLAAAMPGISQVAVSTEVVPGLLRGAHVEAAPLGQWRSAGLFVTAVRVTNLSRFPLEIPLESMRGRWIAATAQHGRIGPAGSDTDTTAVYLVCERSFESCL